jgi:hypothetical protein
MAQSLGFYTRQELSRIGSFRALSAPPAAVLRHYALRARAFDDFDVFLSHCYDDAATILGIVDLLENENLRVYVDWIVDPQHDRTKVDRDTAENLQRRMGQSASLIYATSTSSRSSIWMPWELGYFDGLGKQDHISIMPIEGKTPGSEGQEYLELYPAIEKVRTDGGRIVTAAVAPQSRTFLSITDFARVR